MSHVQYGHIFKRYLNAIRPAGGVVTPPDQPLGLFTLFDEQQGVVDPVPPITLPDPPLSARNEFFSKISSSAQETFESYAVGRLVPGMPGVGLESITVNGITAAITTIPTYETFVGSIRDGTANGRYNCAPGPTVADGTKYWQFSTPIGDVITVTLTFDAPISFFGMYITDIGDFAASMTVTLAITGGGTEVYNPSSGIAANNGALNFWGFVDGRWTGAPGTPTRTYDSVTFSKSDPSDVFGFDGLVWGGFPLIIYPPV